jgi:transposase
MTRLKDAPDRVLGIDVGKATLTVFDSRAGTLSVIDNTAAAIKALCEDLGPGTLVVCEPTGGYEAAVLDELARRGIACHRADTLKVKAFLRSFGTLAKTDAIDARALARYAQERWQLLALVALSQARQAELAALVARRKDLVDLKVAETNRLKAPGLRVGMKAVRASCKVVLRCLQGQIARIDAAIEALLAKSPSLARRIAVSRSLPGVGPRTAITLAAMMPELGSLTRRQAASLAGVAPHPRDSGTLKGYRRMRGGRATIRPVLFMAALAASRAKGDLRLFYQRLVQNGKKPIVAIAALMRKIVVILNARMRDHLNDMS